MRIFKPHFAKFIVLFSFLLPAPFAVYAQTLPDSVRMKKLGVKKLLVLKCEEGFPTDTEYVWTPGTKFSLPGDLTLPDTSRIRRDHAAAKDGFFLLLPVPHAAHCDNDTVGSGYRFDKNGRLVEQIAYSCEKGDNHKYFTYDPKGRLLLCTYAYRPDIFVTREEFKYDTLGHLSAETSWWALHPQSEIRDSTDTQEGYIEYHYDKNGLIWEAVATDPMRRCYGTGDWGHLADWFSGESVRWPDQMTFRYVYVY